MQGNKPYFRKFEGLLQRSQDVTKFAESKGRRFAYFVEHVGPHEAPEPGKAPTRYGEIDE
ncbi:Uncharacterised protein [Oligella urethralis]|nr:Uncharacterised protein [Oligella urethralis]